MSQWRLTRRLRSTVLLFLLFCFLLLVFLDVHIRLVKYNIEAVPYPSMSSPSKHKNRHCNGCFRSEYPLVINQPHICASVENRTIDIVLLISSSPENTDQRDTIRKTWASVSNNNTSNFRHVFMVGTSPDRLRMHKLFEESANFRDIVMNGFNDSYYNLTLKTLSSLHWLNQYCTQARFFFKVDDDIWLNTRRLLETYNRNGDSLQNALGGSCRMSSSVIRDPTAKWYASLDTYPNDQYPAYCSGTGYGGSPRVAKKITAVSKDVPFFHLEDVYMGLCLQRLGLSVVHLQGFRAEPTWDLCDSKSDGVVTYHSVSAQGILKYWKTECGQDNSRFLRRQNLLLDVLFLFQ